MNVLKAMITGNWSKVNEMALDIHNYLKEKYGSDGESNELAPLAIIQALAYSLAGSYKKCLEERPKYACAELASAQLSEIIELLVDAVLAIIIGIEERTSDSGSESII